MSNAALVKKFSMKEVSQFTKIQKKTLEYYCENFLEDHDLTVKNSDLVISSLDIQCLMIAHETSKQGLSKSQISQIILETRRVSHVGQKAHFDLLSESEQRRIIEDYLRAL